VRQVRFDQLRAEQPNIEIEVAFVSWPENIRSWPAANSCSLSRVLQPARVVVYIGCNMDGWACGTQALWIELLNRELLAYVPSTLHHNLIVAGERAAAPREPTAEELCGLLNDGTVPYLTFAQAHELAALDPDTRAEVIEVLRHAHGNAEHGRAESEPRISVELANKSAVNWIVKHSNWGSYCG